MHLRRLSLIALSLSLSAAAHAQTVRTGTGANTAGLQSVVDQFRTDLGGVNNGIGAFAGSTGRREINWDGVPSGFSAPNNLPGSFFNQNSQRGAKFSFSGGGGTGFMVSDNATGGNSAGVRFNNINGTYSAQFTTFSAQKLFTSLGSNVYDVSFFVPLTGAGTEAFTPALVTGFGSVFTDVDIEGATTIEYFDRNNTSMGIFSAPTLDLGLSFVGVSFNTPTIARVRITQGTAALNALTNDNPGGGVDVVAADDFIYGEPQAFSAPEPTTWALLTLGGTLVLLRRKRR